MPEMLVGSDSGESLSEPEKSQIDTQLRMMWVDLRNALADKNIEKALTYVNLLSRDYYRELFKTFGDHLPEIAQEMQDTEPVYIKGHSAKYEMRKIELAAA